MGKLRFINSLHKRIPGFYESKINREFDRKGQTATTRTKSTRTYWKIELPLNVTFAM